MVNDRHNTDLLGRSLMVEDDIPSLPEYFRSISISDNREHSSNENTVVSTNQNSRPKQVEIPYGSSIFRWCRLRGLDGGPWDNCDLSAWLEGRFYWMGGSRNFPLENAAAANTAGFDCVFAFGKSHNLVARGGITSVPQHQLPWSATQYQ